MNQNICRLFAVACLLITFAPAPVLAGGQLYMLSPNAPYWPDAMMPVPFNVNPDSATGSIDSPDASQAFADAAVNAFDTWESVATSRITFTRGPDSIDKLDTDPDDGVNLLVFHTLGIVQGIPIPFPPGVLAVTNTVFDPDTGAMRGGNITFNPNPLPDNPAPDWSVSGAPETLDVEAVILHEAGHLIGLCHSAVRNDGYGDLSGQPTNAAVMFPFIGDDIMDSRIPDQDDIAWISYIYPSELYDTSYGAIQGDVPFGSTLVGGCIPPNGANGAHVVARDLNDLVGGEPRMIVGTYSYTEHGKLGRYLIPGLPPGDYEVWIEPMDGSPVRALQINSLIQLTFNTNFPEDWYSGNSESGTETDPNDSAGAAPVTVTAGSLTEGIDIIIENSVFGACAHLLGTFHYGDSRFAIATSQAIYLLPLFFIYFLRRGVARRD